MYRYFSLDLTQDLDFEANYLENYLRVLQDELNCYIIDLTIQPPREPIEIIDAVPAIVR